ncbi:hypothetical protein [Microbacterium sp. SORGH_AS_0862]|uniref:hypothetical protein n=1 Tax=Microbacterium sp. SORGH_AS_0862 TaxID=3041789 RepID=UPI002790808D|nr:hypothetical protein [Microbacterium sp. SORGH_AS_0862]MDQ1206097.1 hypothetical protein [Microbacterium sp. SORGH_AS_0862]
MAKNSTALTAPQVAVLRWIEAGCPEGVYTEGWEHRIAARALERRGLVSIGGRGPTWRATITTSGRSWLAAPPMPDVLPSDSEAEALISRVVEAGGSLTVEAAQGDELKSLERLVRATLLSGNRPRGQKLELSGNWYYSRSSERTVRLVPYFEDFVEKHPVPVPDRVGKYHPVVRHYLDSRDWQYVSKDHLSRAARILQAIATEAERRGLTVISPSKAKNNQNKHQSRPVDGHLWLQTAHGEYSVQVREGAGKGGRTLEYQERYNAKQAKWLWRRQTEFISIASAISGAAGTPTEEMLAKCRFNAGFMVLGDLAVESNPPDRLREWALYDLAAQLMVDNSDTLASAYVIRGNAGSGFAALGVEAIPAGADLDVVGIVRQSISELAPELRQLVKEADVSVAAPTGYSFARLCEAFLAISDASTTIRDEDPELVTLYTYGIDTIKASVVAEIAPHSHPLLTRAGAAFKDVLTFVEMPEGNPLPTLTVGRSNDTNGYNAGDAISVTTTTYGAACSASFKLVNGGSGYLLTAGHCYSPVAPNGSNGAAVRNTNSYVSPCGGYTNGMGHLLRLADVMTLQFGRLLSRSIIVAVASVGLAFAVTACVGPGAAGGQTGPTSATTATPSPAPLMSVEETVRAAKDFTTYDDAVMAFQQVKEAVDRECLPGLSNVEAEGIEKTFELDRELLTTKSGTYNATTDFTLSFIPTVITVCLGGISPYAP